MAVVDIDRHILTELIVLSEKLKQNAIEFRTYWDIIHTVRERVSLIVIDQKDADNPDLPKLRNQIVRAMKVCNTKMLVMDDAMSKQQALLTHLVTAIQRAESGKDT